MYLKDFIELKVKEDQKEFMLDDILQFSIRLLKNKNILQSLKSELIQNISFNLFLYLTENIKDTRDDVINVEDIHAKFMFQSDISFYNQFLENVTNEKIVYKYCQSNQIVNAYITAFKARKANLLRRDQS